MKILKYFRVAFFLLTTFAASSQVSNDICTDADSLGRVGNINDLNCMIDDFGLLYGNISVYGNNAGALQNFPYPNINLSTNCQGYSPSVAVPAKDIWYKVSIRSDLYMRIQASDTLHVSIWVQEYNQNCNFLSAYKCFTVLPSSYVTDTTPTFCANKIIYLQLSGANALDTTSYHLCLGGSSSDCFGAATNTITTPVTCLDYEINANNPSSFGGNDGNIDVNIINGNPPYLYSWSNGATSSLLTGLLSGNYYVTITDSTGCVTTDSVTLEPPLSNTNIARNIGYEIRCYPIPAHDYINFEINDITIGCQLFLYNGFGQKVLADFFDTSQKAFFIEYLPKGIYFAVIEDKNKNKVFFKQFIKF